MRQTAVDDSRLATGRKVRWAGKADGQVLAGVDFKISGSVFNSPTMNTFPSQKFNAGRFANAPIIHTGLQVFQKVEQFLFCRVTIKKE